MAHRVTPSSASSASSASLTALPGALRRLLLAVYGAGAAVRFHPAGLPWLPLAHRLPWPAVGAPRRLPRRLHAGRDGVFPW